MRGFPSTVRKMTLTLAEAYTARLEFYDQNQPRAKDGKWTRGGGARGSTPDKVWTGVSAHPDQRSKPQMNHEAWAELKEYYADVADRIFNTDLGNGYSSVAVDVEFYDYGGSGREAMASLAVAGAIMKDGKTVGEFSRQINLSDGEVSVYHDQLVIDSAHQGAGLADRFNSHAIAEYQRLGVDHVSLEAGLETGAYAWARQGFRYKEEGERSRKEFAGEVLKGVVNTLHAPVMRPFKAKIMKEVKAIQKALDAGEDVQPIHLASIGEKYARYTGRDDDGKTYETWPGKSALLGRTWDGVYYFDASQPVTASATSLEHANLRPAFGMSTDLSVRLTEALACHTAACRPPTSGGTGGSLRGAVLPDVSAKDVRFAYRPRHPDGHADPGEVVWARVPFEDDPTQGKDRPVLIVGRATNGNLVGVQLSTKTHHAGSFPIEWGSDKTSHLRPERFIQVDLTNYRKEGAYIKKPVFQEIVATLTKRHGLTTQELSTETATFACHSAACAPPVGGSLPKGWDKGAQTLPDDDTDEPTVHLRSASVGFLGVKNSDAHHDRWESAREMFKAEPAGLSAQSHAEQRAWQLKRHDEMVAAFGSRQSVGPGEVWASQVHIRLPNVEKLVHEIADSVAIGVRYGGKTYVMDGHHRMVANWKKGDKADLDVIDLDALERAHKAVQASATLTESLACHEASCRPPTSGGTGGSSGMSGITYGGGRFPLTVDVLRNATNTFISIADPDTLSGYKAHVYADNVDDIAYILRRIKPYLATKENPDGWGAKVATDAFFKLTADGHPQQGKAVTIYFPQRATWERDLKGLVRDMEDLPSRMHKEIANEDYAGNGVSWRFELRGDPGRDLSPREYHDWYQSSFDSGDVEEFGFDPNQKRDKDGQWTTSGSAGFPGLSPTETGRVKPKHMITYLTHDALDKVGFGDDHLDLPTRSAHFIKSIFDAELPGGITSTMQIKQVPGGITTVTGHFVNSNGVRMGEFERSINWDGPGGRTVVQHETLVLNPEYQGMGIAEAFNSHALAKYRQIGVDHIEVYAGSTVGGYAWAVAGFRFAPKEPVSARGRVVMKAKEKLVSLSDNGHITSDQRRKYESEIDALVAARTAGEDVQPVHFASIGRGEQFTVSPRSTRPPHWSPVERPLPYTTWAGKEMMLGNSWEGVYYLGEPLTASAVEEFYDASQKRDRRGRWTTGGSAVPVPNPHRYNPKCTPPPCVDESIERSDTMGRQLLHRSIVRRVLVNGTPPPTLTILGGGGGAGKSTVKEKLGLGKEQVDLNVDDIKEMIPEYQQLTRNGDTSAAAFVHEESSKIGKDVQKQARENQFGLILDQVGSNPTKVRAQIDDYAAAGYHDIQAVYVTVPTAVAVERAQARAERTGRAVPLAVLEAAHRDVSRGFEEIARHPALSSVRLVDNSGPEPIVIAQGGHGRIDILDQARYDEFLAKGG